MELSETSVVLSGTGDEMVEEEDALTGKVGKMTSNNYCTVNFCLGDLDPKARANFGRGGENPSVCGRVRGIAETCTR